MSLGYVIAPNVNHLTIVAYLLASVHNAELVAHVLTKCKCDP